MNHERMWNELKELLTGAIESRFCVPIAKKYFELVIKYMQQIEKENE